MRPTVVIVGTLDTKGDEVAYLKELVECEDCATIVMDVGILRAPLVPADIAPANRLSSVLEEISRGSSIAETEDLPWRPWFEVDPQS